MAPKNCKFFCWINILFTLSKTHIIQKYKAPNLNRIIIAYPIFLSKLAFTYFTSSLFRFRKYIHEQIVFDAVSLEVLGWAQTSVPNSYNLYLNNSQNSDLSFRCVIESFHLLLKFENHEIYISSHIFTNNTILPISRNNLWSSIINYLSLSSFLFHETLYSTISAH